MSRAYYSGFKPVKGTPLENVPQMDPWREIRLYQASYLLRDYGYDLEELTLGPDQNLPLAYDPKVAWAEQHLAGHPLEINRADRQELLRIPGIGPLGATRLLEERTRGTLLKEPGQLYRLGIRAEKLMPYILLNGKRPASQPSLFQSTPL